MNLDQMEKTILTTSDSKNQLLFPDFKVIPQCVVPFELCPEDISFIHQCLNKFISPSYSPLDDSVFDSFIYYLNLLFKSTSFVLVEKVKNLFRNEYDTFDEAYEKTLEDLICYLQSERAFRDSYTIKALFSHKNSCKKLYLKSRMRKYSHYQHVLQGHEVPSQTYIHFLTLEELEKWIVLMKQNFTLLSHSAQTFALKFVALISQNVKCFQLMQSKGVYEMFYTMFLSQGFRLRCLFVQTLNVLLKHKEGREYVIPARDMWKAIIEVELEKKESNFYYLGSVIVFIMNLTIVPHSIILKKEKVVTRNLFKIISMLNLQSKTQMKILHEILQRLLGRYSSDEISYDDMSSIVNFIKNIFSPMELGSNPTELDTIVLHYEIQTYLDRLSMNYDNEVGLPMSGAHQEFLLKTIYNLECVLSLVIMDNEVNKSHCESEFSFNKWFDYAELCCVIYLSRTPRIAFYPCRPEIHSIEGSETEICLNTFGHIIKMILSPIFEVLKMHWTTSYSHEVWCNSLTKLNFDESLGTTNPIEAIGLCAGTMVPAAMKAFVCFRRIVPLLQEIPYLSALCRQLVEFLVTPLTWSPTEVPINSFVQICQQLPGFTSEYIHMVTYLLVLKDPKIEISGNSFPPSFGFDHLHNLLSCAVQNDEVQSDDPINLRRSMTQQTIIQSLLTLQKAMLNNYPIPTNFLQHPTNPDWLVIKLLNSESWAIRDSILEVLLTELKIILCFPVLRQSQSTESSTIIRHTSEFIRFTLMAENDSERFVRASAVHVVHLKLLSFLSSASQSHTESNIPYVVVDSMLRVCCNEQEDIVQVKAIKCLVYLFRRQSKRDKPAFFKIIPSKIIPLRSRYFHDVREILKYYAIKNVQFEVKSEALKFFVSLLRTVWSARHVSGTCEEIFMEKISFRVVEIKVLLSILLFDEDVDTVIWLSRQLSQMFNKKKRVIYNEPLSEVRTVFMSETIRIVTKDTTYNTIRSMHIDEIVSEHGELMFSKTDMNESPNGINNTAHSNQMMSEIVNTGDSDEPPRKLLKDCFTCDNSNDMIGDIVNTDDIELLVSNNKPKNRYFSVNSIKTTTQSSDKLIYPEFHTKNTFFDPKYSNEDVLCIFLSMASKDSLWSVVKRRFGVNMNESDTSYYKMRSLMSDILMYDRKTTLQDNIDCY
uniref:Uncharacterized protein n=1 Tax=Cacopsylla melanoneura TaxID=428564 RepID=A0A8D8Y9A4_9HEMI